MPEGNVEWAMFLYFALGALGGIAFLALIVADLVNALRTAWRKHEDHR